VGFTAEHLGPGRYRVTFTTPFAVPPAVVVTKVFGSPTVDAGAAVLPAENAIVDQALVGSAIVATGNSVGVPTDGTFAFLAMTTP
jgi:hypothetical protein